MISRRVFVYVLGILLTGYVFGQKPNSGSQCGALSVSASMFAPQASPPEGQRIVTSAASDPKLTMTARTGSGGDLSLIGETLQSYQRSFNGSNLNGVKQTWPSLDNKRERKFKEVFEFFGKNSFTPSLGFRCIVPTVVGEQANVSCLETLAYSDKKGKCHQVQPAQVTIHMERASDAWVIRNMAARD